MDTKTYLSPGESAYAELPYSEVCMHMRIAGTVMLVQLTDGEWPMAQLWKDGRRFSMAITTGEAGIYHDAEGHYLYPQVRSFRCGCCGDDVMGSRPICDDCHSAGCEQTTDASGELGYWECQRTDTDEHEHEVSVIYSIPDRVMGGMLVRGAQVTECSCGHRLSYEPRS